MECINNFEIIADKTNVLKAISSYYKFSNDLDIDFAYYELEQLAKSIVTPLGLFILDKMPGNINSNLLKSCESIVYCIFTIGDDITNAVDSLFLENEFEKALILDAISTSILFNISKQFYDKVFEYTSKRNLGLTCRIAPGDGEIDIAYQKDIVMKFEENKFQKFSLINDYLVKPYKSLSYVFGADGNIKANKEDHKCDTCNNMYCFMRDSIEKIRGPFDNVAN